MKPTRQMWGGRRGDKEAPEFLAGLPESGSCYLLMRKGVRLEGKGCVWWGGVGTLNRSCRFRAEAQT